MTHALGTTLDERATRASGVQIMNVLSQPGHLANLLMPSPPKAPPMMAPGIVPAIAPRGPPAIPNIEPM
jgi:hypothetical protein